MGGLTQADLDGMAQKVVKSARRGIPGLDALDSWVGRFTKHTKRQRRNMRHCPKRNNNIKMKRRERLRRKRR